VEAASHVTVDTTAYADPLTYKSPCNHRQSPPSYEMTEFSWIRDHSGYNFTA